MQALWRIFLGLSALWTIYCLALLSLLWLFESGRSANRSLEDLKIHGILVDAAPDGTRKLALSAYRSGGGAAGWSHREVIVCAAPKTVGASDPDEWMVAQVAVRVSGPPVPRYR
jgi:hypothetical protein